MRLFNIKKPRDRVDDVPSNERPVFTSDEKPEAPALSGETPVYNFDAKPVNEKPPKKGIPTRDEPETEPSEDEPDEGNTESEPSESEPAESEEQTESGEVVSSTEYDPDHALTEFYDRLYDRLRSYGIMSIPSFDELYGLLESFLRPAIDAAIEARNRTGRQNMAELDADAYSRGMGGSSWLTSVKAREQDDIASDVAALEGKYASSMGEYLYKALSAMQSMESELRRAQMSIAASSGRSHSGSGRSSSASGGAESGENDPRIHANLGYMPYGHNKDGAYFDGVWYDGDFSYFDKDYAYVDYWDYLNRLTPGERYLFFTSNSKEWRIKRWQVQYNLPQVDYLDLVEIFMPSPRQSGGSGGTWTMMTK